MMIVGDAKPIGERERRKYRDPLKKRKRKLSEREEGETRARNRVKKRKRKPSEREEGETRARNRVKKRKRKLSEREEGETRVRNRVKKRKRREREEGETKNRKRVKKGKPKLSEKRLAETRLPEKKIETETKLDPQPQPKKKEEKAKKYKKKYRDMTKDEVVNLCSFSDRPRARLVVDDLRNYLIQNSESERFDCDVFPGCFSGVTWVYPVEYCGFNRFVYKDYKRLAIAGITKYNLANNETEYEVVDVDKVNVSAGCCIRSTYFVTFDARDVKANDGVLKTFQAIVETNKHGFISNVRLCRPKLS